MCSVTFMVHMGKSAQCVEPHQPTIWISFTHLQVSLFASLAFHQVYSRVYFFLLRLAFSFCGFIVKSVQCKANISKGRISPCVAYAVSFLALEGLIGNDTFVNWICRFLCYLEILVSLPSTEREIRPTQIGLIIISEINVVATQVTSNQII